jgi:hypothetical protein
VRSGGYFDDIVPPADAPTSEMPESEGGQFAAPLPDGRNFRVAREGISPPAPPKGFVANAADFAKSIPHGIVGGISSALSATGAAANAEMSQPEDPNPTPQEIRQALEENVTGATHRPEGNAGKFGAAIGEALGTPTSYLGPGSLLASILGAVGGEGGRQAAEDTKYETLAQLLGGLIGGIAGVKTLGAPRPTSITPRGPNPRAGPQPPTRPPDKAAAQSDWTNSEARASGPFALEAGEQHALGSATADRAIGIPTQAHAPIASASVATNSVPTAAESGPKLIGSFTPPAGLKYGGTDFGIHAHEKAARILQDRYTDVPLVLRVARGEQGVDVSVPEKYIASVGFAHAEIKPLSASGEKKLRQQVFKWEYDPSTVQAITYDANGNVYFGFR